ncbi:MAG: alpha/beta fold hydrolase [Planctomycetota bacterium]|jgi:pimeloyl-ACP methyl ester carboxylesterase
MFSYVDRKQKKDLIIIPGWAFDQRIFAQLDLPYNYFFFCNESIADFQDSIEKLMTEKQIQKISLLGWSQGAFAASDFACKNPEAIDEIILIGIRQKYENFGLEKIKDYLKKNKKAYLRSFYKQCFCDKEKQLYCWFKDNLLNDYLEKMSLDRLIKDLDWLKTAQINTDQLRKLNCVKIVQGQADAIAPIEQSAAIAESLKFITFENTGHLPFLHRDFGKRLYE